jgi:ketosteroid isomerase-like protein
MDRVNADDWDALRALHADNAFEKDMITGQRWEGAATLVDGYRVFKSAFPDLHATVTAAHCSGSDVALEIELTGTHTGPMTMGDDPDLAPTNRKIKEFVCDVIEVRDGKITQIRAYHSHEDLLHQLGVKE